LISAELSVVNMGDNSISVRTRCPHHNPEGKDGKIEMKLIEVESGHWVDQCGIKCGQNG